MATGEWWRDPPKVNPDRARDAVEASRDEVLQLRESVSVLCMLVDVLADRRVPERTSDATAERRAIGWMLSGKCAVADFAALTIGYDFTTRARTWVAGLAMELLDTSDDRLPPARRTIWLACDQLVELGHRELADSARAEVHALPGPAQCPTTEIALVAALARQWSEVDQKFNVDPFEVRG